MGRAIKKKEGSDLEPEPQTQPAVRSTVGSWWEAEKGPWSCPLLSSPVYSPLKSPKEKKERQRVVCAGRELWVEGR